MTSSKPTREWFRDWFGEEYLAIYPHRDEREAREAVDLYREVASPEPGSRLLDLACGAGRHLRELRAAGLDATGLDLSLTLLRSARSSGAADPLVRGDMRQLPFSTGSFGGLTSFFTSFGYFADAHRGRMSEPQRVQRPSADRKGVGQGAVQECRLARARIGRAAVLSSIWAAVVSALGP